MLETGGKNFLFIIWNFDKMKISGIYSITNTINNKRYIGKSVNIKGRFWHHKNNLTKEEINRKAVNRHLFNSVKRHGIDNFLFEILECFIDFDENYSKERELYWMDFFNTCDRNFGYNLRRDSSTKMIVHEETRRIISENNMGSKNPNYGNYWSDEQRARMSQVQKARDHTSFYTPELRAKLSKASKLIMSNPETRKKLSESVRKAKEKKYCFIQYTRKGEFIKRWETVREIIESNPNYKWQNIYSVCNGYKPTYMNCIWKKFLKI